MCGILSARQQSARGYFLPDAVARYVQLYRQETIISLLLILLMVPFCLLASEDDKATNQRIIQSITIFPGSLDMKEGTTVQLAAVGHYGDGVERNLTSQVTWSVSNFGTAAVGANGTLRARREGTTTLRASLGNIESEAGVVVYKEINGFRLPPEPDPRMNDSTLLGVDSNDNGIRDDVERFVIVEEAKNREYPKTQTAIAFQFAWAWQKMIENPTLESDKYLASASACQRYFFSKKTKDIKDFAQTLEWKLQHYGVLGTELEDKIFNTRERIKKRFEFLKACSGKIFELMPAELTACLINIDGLGE